MALPNFSSKDCFMSFAGVPLDGLAPDTFISFELSEGITDVEVGADGSVSISISPNDTGTCTITLQQQSLGNAILAGIVGQQKSSRQLVVGDITITNPGGSTLAVLSGCHIQTAPTVEFGSTATGKNRAWTFFVERMIFSGAPSGSALSGANSAFISGNIAGAFSF